MISPLYSKLIVSNPAGEERLDDAKRRSQPRSITLPEQLPDEFWQQILEYLAGLDKKHLAEVSSRSREAVNLPSFDTLALRASDLTTLKKDVTSCISMPKASKRFLGHRCLEVVVQVSAWQHLRNDDEVSFPGWLTDVGTDLPELDSSAARRATTLRSRDTQEHEHQNVLNVSCGRSLYALRREETGAQL